MGNLYSQTFPPKARWSVQQMPDLKGKIAIVTGANVGIGKETAKQLLARVYIAARSKSKAETAIAELKAETGKEALFLELDLGDLVAIKRSAQAFLAAEPSLNILIANAGVWCPPMDELTKQGYDLQLGTNALGHWYFTQLLLPGLLKGVSEGGARVVTLSSVGSDLAKPVIWDAFTDTPARRKLTLYDLYNQSKLFNLLLSIEYARRYADTGIIFSSLNPGNIETDLLRRVTGIQRSVLGMLLYPVQQGALTSLYAATSPEATENGAYYIPWARRGVANAKARDPVTGARVWEWMEEQIKGI
ncbi:NAD(P)-binding protein [Exidia glandulosa HHB12029]|uniref:NAD(P)-binding protein n=1 Tax=Exidia glandulosa HHB12029 TaxID=1314781 RepID=A0A165NQS7_EXIGL|nr:NAD(P)-binding protein [Exidia glandulosa HHB12029]